MCGVITINMARFTRLILIITLFCAVNSSYKTQMDIYNKFGSIPIEYRHKFTGRYAGYPAPAKGNTPYPARVHPGTLTYSSLGKPIHTSPNDVVGGVSVAAPDYSEWDFPLDPNICRKVNGLTRSQMHICRKYTDVTAAAVIGLTFAVKECRTQFKNNRWNCTSLSSFSKNPYAAPIVERGYSESAFVHAIMAAGVTHSVARACAAGRLSSCACGNVKGRRAWKWSGCHDNTKFGARFSRMFLDIREKAKDVLSFTHLYNNEIGRKLVRRNRQVHCKCHGLSGSCEVRTCWKAVPNFKKVGKMLVQKYENAKSASHTVFGNSVGKLRNFKPIRRKITLESPLLYAERSPTFCSAEQRLGVKGTQGRQCNKTSVGLDSCDTLCCGRGYDVRRVKIIRKCHCKFKWCCHVTCEDCSTVEWITMCK